MHKQGVGDFPFYCGINSLSELATKDDRCVVLNILGKESSGVTPISNDYSGGNIVFGTGPGKSGKFLPTKTGKIPVYNSKAYLAGKHTWSPITINLREDVNNNVQKITGEQIQKQFDFFEQSSAASGQDYKFTTRIEILDGGNGANAPTTLETFELYGCFITNANYNELAYANNEPVRVTMEVQYDNAIQTPQGTGIGTAVGRTVNTLITGGGV